MPDRRAPIHGHSGSGDPTAEAGIDIGQHWREPHTGDTFTVARTFRDHPVNPSFLIEYDAPAQSRGKRIVTLTYFAARCERAT